MDEYVGGGSGEAEFMLCKNRAGEVLRSWTTAPGSLVLLRAPGFAGVDDGRLLHAVRGPLVRERISVTYRMDSRSGHPHYAHYGSAEFDSM